MAMFNFDGVEAAKDVNITPLIPQGRYMAMCVAVENVANCEGAYDFKWTVQVGQYKGSIVEDRIFTLGTDENLQKKTLQKIVALFEALEPNKKLQNMDSLQLDMLFKSFAGKIACLPVKQSKSTKDSKTYFNNRLYSFYPASKYESKYDDELEHIKEYQAFIDNGFKSTDVRSNLAAQGEEVEEF